MGRLRFSVHPLYLALGVVLFLLGKGYLFCAWTITVIFHEFAHAEAARLRGFRLDNLRLMPYGAEVGGSMIGSNAADEVIIALAGPIANFALAILFAGLMWFFPSIYFFAEDFILANLATAIINLLPVFPMDGGRVMLALLCGRLERKRAVRIARRVGIVLGALLLVLFVVDMAVGEGNITIAILGSFMLMSAILSFKSEGYRRVLSKHFKSMSVSRGLMVKEIAVPHSMSLRSLALLLNDNYYYKVSVVDENLKILYILNEDEVEKLMIDFSLNLPLSECL